MSPVHYQQRLGIGMADIGNVVTVKEVPNPCQRLGSSTSLLKGNPCRERKRSFFHTAKTTKIFEEKKKKERKKQQTFILSRYM